MFKYLFSFRLGGRMVLTDMPFHRPDAVASRYTLLKTPENGFTKEEEENKQIRSQEYAAFLKWVVTEYRIISDLLLWEFVAIVYI